MSDIPSAKTQDPRPVRRLGRTVMVVVQIVAFVIALISLNYLSCAKHSRADLTERKNFTLSDFTTKLLKGDSVQNHPSPIRIIAVIRRNSTHYSRMRNLLDEYSRLGGDAVTLEFVDPSRQTDRTLEIAKIYERPYTEDMIIIDGRVETKEASSDGEAPDTEQTKPISQQKLSAHVRTMNVKQLYLQDPDQFGNLYISAWQDEDVITSSVIGAVEGVPRKMYFASDKSSLDGQGGKSASRVLSKILWKQNIQLIPIRLVDIQSIPEDAEGFALIGPQYDLEEREIKILAEYWDRPKSSVFITLDPAVKLDRLRIFLRNYGITPRHDRIITKQGKAVLSSAPATFSPGSEITRDLGGKSTIFDGSSGSLDIRENDDQLLNRSIIPIALIQASEGWWGETRDNEENPVFNPEEDNQSPLYISAAILRGQATSDDTAYLVSKMVIIGNTDFISEKNLRPEQTDFITSSINWLIGREDLIGIGPKKLHRHKLTILDSHHTYISWVLLFYLPAALILISLFIWNIRRA